MSGKVLPINGLHSEESSINYVFNDKQMAALFVMIKDIVGEVWEEKMRLTTERPMNLEQMVKFLDRHEVTILAMVRKGVIRAHKLEGCKEYYFFASEVVEDIKRRKK